MTPLRPGRRESPKMEWPRFAKIRVGVALFACLVPLSLAADGFMVPTLTVLSPVMLIMGD